MQAFPGDTKPGGASNTCKKLSGWRAYVFAVASTATVLWVRVSFSSWFENRRIFILLVLPIFLSAQFGGAGPGLIATLVAAVGVDYFLIPPTHTLLIGGSADMLQLLVLIGTGILISVVTDAWQRAAHGAQEALRRANARLEERQHSMELAQSQQSRSEARLAGIVGSAMDAIISVDSEQRVILFNAAAEKMFRCSASEALGQRLDRFIPQRFRAEHSRHVEGFGKTGVTSRSKGSLGALWGMRAGGEEFPLEASISQIDVEGQKVYTVILRDITQRRRAEIDAVLLAAIVESSDDAIVGKDLQGIVTSWNTGAQGLFGYSAWEMAGQSITRLIPPDRIQEEDEILDRIRRGQHVRHFETVRLRKDGSRVDVSVTVSPIKDAEGNVIGASKVARDITERTRAEAEIRDLYASLERRVTERTAELLIAKERAESADRLKSEFLANMSHELRTPLNGIIGFTEFLIDGKPGPLNAKQKEYLADVHDSGAHLLQLINDILDLAKVEAGRMDLNPETFPLSKAVEEVATIIKGGAHARRVNLECAVSPLLGNVTLDQPKFKQILYNLLANAVKFTDAGGRVEIIVRPLEEGQFEVRVADTGTGIRQEDLQRLFREFEQLDSGAGRRFQGTGLGLALTKKLVEFQGGTVNAESEYGKGSTFTVVLPTAVAEVKTHG